MTYTLNHNLTKWEKSRIGKQIVFILENGYTSPARIAYFNGKKDAVVEWPSEQKAHIYWKQYNKVWKYSKS